ncbi:hypothetical protein BH09PSE1_BH09PSE1_22200 [soil metagenome]
MILPAAPEITSDDILDTLEEIVSSALALTTVLNSQFSHTETSGLAPFALRAIHMAGRRGLSQIDLARALHRSAPSTTRLVDHLEHERLVVRSAHPSDRRVNMIHLSETGRTMLDNVLANALAFGLRLFDAESETSIKEFRLKLCRITSISKDIRSA